MKFVAIVFLAGLTLADDDNEQLGQAQTDCKNQVQTSREASKKQESAPQEEEEDARKMPENDGDER